MKTAHSIRNYLWNVRLSLQGSAPQKYQELVKWQELDRDEVRSRQEAILRSLLRSAHERVPYYREILSKHGLVDGGDVRLERFSSLPLLDKEILRGRFEDLKSDDLKTRKWRQNTSGGSTGEPVRFIQDRAQHSWALAAKQLFNHWSGYKTGMPRIRLWGSERDLLVGSETLKTKISRWLRNEHYLNAFRMGENRMRQFVQIINKVQPVQILAYVETMVELAQFAERHSLSVYSPQAVMTSAGTLYPHMRGTIGSVFRAPIFNRYGSREVGDIACECEEHEGLHVCAPTHYVEILRSNGSPARPGEVGEIVVTLLTNRSMPLIRYRIGDMGAWAEKSCSCGRSWPLLEKVTGRVSDTFVNRRGDAIHGEYFTHLFYHEDWVHKFQVVQEATDRIVVRMVASEGSASLKQQYREEMQAITRDIRSAMGPSCEVEFEFEDDIAPTDSGKYRYTISKVDRTAS
jgi:phenylacetate-CoA ligase